MYLKQDVQTETGGVAIENTTCNIQQAHDKLGHGNETITRKTAAKLGWRITCGKMKPCATCSVAKAKRKAITTEENSKEQPDDKR